MALLLLIHCLLMFHLGVGFLCLVLVMQYFLGLPSSHWGRESLLLCFRCVLDVQLLASAPLHCKTVDWSVVCDCYISWSNSLGFSNKVCIWQLHCHWMKIKEIAVLCEIFIWHHAVHVVWHSFVGRRQSQYLWLLYSSQSKNLDSIRESSLRFS